MIKKLKLHIKKYIFYDIFVVILFILVNIFLIKFIHDYQESKNTKYDFTSYKTSIKEAYDNGKLIINFDNNDIGIIKVDDLITANNCVDGICDMPIINQMSIKFTKDLDQCVGYIVIEKLKNNELSIDTSHICDMIDY